MIAVIAATLFPLWPAEMRVGVYYLSVGAGCFVASILLLAVGKYAVISFFPLSLPLSLPPLTSLTPLSISAVFLKVPHKLT